MSKQTAGKPSPSETSSDRLAGWLARSDRGPHIATLPSGQQVTFVVPDSNALIRANKLPDDLVELAMIAAAYQGGADAYMEDLAVQAIRGDVKAKAKLNERVREGIELGDWLLAHMVVDPPITPDDAKGLPEGDRDMLLAFAERRENVDAEGVVLPIALLAEYARFRDVAGGGTDDAGRAGVDPDVPAVDGGADGGDV